MLRPTTLNKSNSNATAAAAVACSIKPVLNNALSKIISASIAIFRNSMFVSPSSSSSLAASAVAIANSIAGVSNRSRTSSSSSVIRSPALPPTCFAVSNKGANAARACSAVKISLANMPSSSNSTPISAALRKALRASASAASPLLPAKASISSPTRRILISAASVS